MANAIKWQSWNDRGSVLTTELNSLANSSRTNAGTEVSNQTNKDQWGKLELTVTFGTNPNATAYVEVCAVTAPDGTNYEDGSSSVDPGGHTVIAYIPVKATTSAQRLCSPPFRMDVDRAGAL